MLPGAVWSPRPRLVEQGPPDGGFRLILGVSVAPRSCAVGEESACCLLRGHGVPFLSTSADLLNGRACWGQALPETSVEAPNLSLCDTCTPLSPSPAPVSPLFPHPSMLPINFHPTNQTSGPPPPPKLATGAPAFQKPVCVHTDKGLSPTHPISTHHHDFPRWVIEFFPLFCLIFLPKQEKSSLKSSRKSNKNSSKDGLDIEKQQNYKIGFRKESGELLYLAPSESPKTPSK